jgi:hypothetical protein
MHLDCGPAVPIETGNGNGDGSGGVLRVSGHLASGDGHTLIRVTRHGDDPEAVGAAVARALLDGNAASIEGFDGPLDA